MWPHSQQPSQANLWRFHYGRSQVPAHTNARGPGKPATSPGGGQATIQFPTRHRLTQLAAISPYIACMSSHVNPCQPKLTQLPLAEGRATATLHTTSGVIGWGSRKWIYKSFPHWSLPKHGYAETKQCNLPVKNELNKLFYGKMTTQPGIQVKTKDI